MATVGVIILHAEAAPSAGPLEALGRRRRRVARAERPAGGVRGGRARRTSGSSPASRTARRSGRGCGSSSRAGATGRARRARLGLDSARDRRPTVGRFVAAAASDGPASPDQQSLLGGRRRDRLRARSSRDLPDLPADNALPRWLAEVAGLPRRRADGRGGSGRHRRPARPGPAAARRGSVADADAVHVERHRAASTAALDRAAAVARDRAGELVVAGRTSSDVAGWLERRTAARSARSSRSAGCGRRTRRPPRRRRPGPAARVRSRRAARPRWPGSARRAAGSASATPRSSTPACCLPTASAPTRTAGPRRRTASRRTCCSTSESQTRGSGTLTRSALEAPDPDRARRPHARRARASAWRCGEPMDGLRRLPPADLEAAAQRPGARSRSIRAEIVAERPDDVRPVHGARALPPRPRLLPERGCATGSRGRLPDGAGGQPDLRPGDRPPRRRRLVGPRLARRDFTIREHGAGSGALAGRARRRDPGRGTRSRRRPPLPRRRGRSAPPRGARAPAWARSPSPTTARRSPASSSPTRSSMPCRRIGSWAPAAASREVFVGIVDGRLGDVVAEPSTPALAARLAAEGITLADGQRAEVCLALDAWVAEAAAGLRARSAAAHRLRPPGGGAVRQRPASRGHARRLPRPPGPPRPVSGDRPPGPHRPRRRHRGRASRGRAPASSTSRRRPRARSSRVSARASCSSDLQSAPNADLPAYLEARSALVRMIDPAAMGGFAVMAFGRGLPDGAPLRGLTRTTRDRTGLGRSPYRHAIRANAHRSLADGPGVVAGRRSTAGGRIANWHARSARSVPRPRPPCRRMGTRPAGVGGASRAARRRCSTTLPC